MVDSLNLKTCDGCETFEENEDEEGENGSLFINVSTWIYVVVHGLALILFRI